jgi:hypothetical protein
LTITADDADLPITWCGFTWLKSTTAKDGDPEIAATQAYSGETKCACPTAYVVPTSTFNANQWLQNGLKMYHDTLFGIVAGRKVILSPGTLSETSVCNGGQNNCNDTSAGVFAGSPIRGCLPKVNPTANYTTSPAVIEDCQFLDHTVGGVNYKWEKGINWP